MITVFKNFKATTEPHYVEVDVILDRIKKCHVQKQIDKIHTETDPDKKRELKKGLPCICFSGKFLVRADEAIREHSGFAILDFDKVADLSAKKKELCSMPFVYSVFISPSGNGLKALVRIPAIIEKHRGYYEGLKKTFPDIDVANKNESRICYESCDQDIYINKNAIEFTDYVDTKPIVNNNLPVDYKETDYRKIDSAVKIIRNSYPGEYHNELVKASYLMGGFVSGGHITESEAIRILEDEIQRKDIASFKDAQTTIKKCLEDGKLKPIIDEQPLSKIVARQPSKPVTPKLEFLSTDHDTDEYLESHRTGSFKMGLTTGFTELDKHFRFKPEHLVMVLGHDNVGKSTIIWFMACLSAVLHGWNWIIFTAENRTGFVKKKLIEFYVGKVIKKMSDDEYIRGKIWVNDHFSIIKNDDLYNYADMLNMGRELLKQKRYDSFLIDPYNALYKKTTNEHQYDYAAMMEFRVFIKQTGCSIYLNMHAVTEALRRMYPKEHEYAGYPMPPNKADAEGGGKFASKADDFLVIHRLTNHKEEWMYTQVHVAKVKESESGGCQTFKDDPVKLILSKGGVGFEDLNEFNPILHKKEPVNPDRFIEPNKEFNYLPTDEIPF